MDPTFTAETYHSTVRHADHDDVKVVVKRCNHRDDPRTLSRWRNEVDALTRVGAHPNIVHLISASEADLSITLSLAPGRVMSSYHPSDLCPHARRICLDLARALAHIHAAGLIHDDVKPENVMLAIRPTTPRHPTAASGSPVVDNDDDDDGTQVVTTLIDFGACIPTHTFTPSGTPWYAAPEFVACRPKGPATDVWALGVTMAWVLGRLGAEVPGTARDEWILPRVLAEPQEMEKMRGWLDEVAGVRAGMVVGGEEEGDGDGDGLARVVAEMLQVDPERRVGCAEIVRWVGPGAE